MMKHIALSLSFACMLLCSCRDNKTAATADGQAPVLSQTEQTDTLRAVPDEPTADEADGKAAEGAPVSKITAEMAYEGVNNYCHREYDWSPAEENPSVMYVAMGDETETEYKVIFRSYTAAFVYFYVDKTSGKTRMVESVPGLNIEEETGTIDLFDYLKKE